jgi:hypothetical protein
MIIMYHSSLHSIHVEFFFVNKNKSRTWNLSYSDLITPQMTNFPISHNVIFMFLLILQQRKKRKEISTSPVCSVTTFLFHLSLYGRLLFVNMSFHVKSINLKSVITRKVLTTDKWSKCLSKMLGNFYFTAVVERRSQNFCFTINVEWPSKNIMHLEMESDSVWYLLSFNLTEKRS